MKKREIKPGPHAEKSTMTEPQEEFIEAQSRPSVPDGPPESASERQERERREHNSNK